MKSYRGFANDPGDLGSIPRRVIPKTLKMVLDTSLLNIQQYKVLMECKEKRRNCVSFYRLGLIFFQAAVTSILLYGCTTWTLTKRLDKKLEGNYTRMLRAILNKSWQQHPTRHQLYGHLPPITKTIQVRRTRHAGHCWRSRDELIRDVLLWIPTHGRAKAGRPARTYIQQLCEDTGCCPEDLPRAMNDKEEWRERVRDIRATSTIWWWWWSVKWSNRGKGVAPFNTSE